MKARPPAQAKCALLDEAKMFKKKYAKYKNPPPYAKCAQQAKGSK